MAARRTLVDAKCLNCGETFRPKAAGQRFCNRDCWYAWPGRIEDKACPVCGESFRPKAPEQKTCSKPCADEIRRTSVRATSCAQCGGPLNPKSHSRVRFCSRACAKLGRKLPGTRPIGSTAAASAGYRQIKTEAGWVLEHRYVMEQILGRPLEPHERVHHRNGNRADNRPENLELWKVKKKDPAGVRAEDYHCAGCTCFHE